MVPVCSNGTNDLLHWNALLKAWGKKTWTNIFFHFLSNGIQDATTSYLGFRLIDYDESIIVLFGIKGHVALDINPGQGYNTLVLRLIPGDLYIACHHGQFHKLPGLLHSQVALPNSYPHACMPSSETVYTIFIMVFVMTLPPRTRDLPYERRKHANH